MADLSKIHEVEGGSGLDPLPRRAQASNVWAVDGTRTVRGAPILVNDPHLDFAAPVAWYLTDIRTPKLDLSRATIPGSPFHLVGHNGTIAWGITATGADTQDLVFETLAGSSGSAYRTPGGTASLVASVETIKVRGGEPIEIVTCRTRHGPDVLGLRTSTGAFDPNEQLLVLAATALDEQDSSAAALYALNRARSRDAAFEALAPMIAPVLNVVVAHVQGAISMATFGAVPDRTVGNGLEPVDGSAVKRLWSGYLPANALARTVDPPVGFMANANEDPGAGSPGVTLNAAWIPSLRTERLHSLLAARRPLSFADHSAIQGDVRSPLADALVPLLVEAVLADPAHTEMAAWLAAWDREMSVDSGRALLFAAWLDAATRLTFAADMSEIDYEILAPYLPYRLAAALMPGTSSCDETCGEVLRAALEQALTRVASAHGPDRSRWRWGREHIARHEHPLFSTLPILARLETPRAGTSGSIDTLNRGTFRLRRAEVGIDLGHVHGPGLRAIMDLSDLSGAAFVLATGQSGNSLSRHYADQIGIWARGEFPKAEE